jgi:AcrR family transcriptional regulator
MRHRIVAAALEVLQRQGAAALTVRNITRLAGCSTTGVYTYFGGKHGVVEAIYLGGFDAFDEAVTPGLASGDLPAAGRAYRRWAIANPTQYMVMFGRAVPDFEPSPAAHERSMQSFLDLAAAVGRVFPDEDAGERAYHYWATLHGYVMLEIAGMTTPGRGEPDALFERALERLAAT